ncbi:MAG TPA: CAP domain-containing protein, partial [Steroidobacteraceae bacterium]
LRPDPLLARVAEALASGRSLREAMTGAGYRAAQSAVLEVSGSDTGKARALAERGCRDIVDPVYRDVGVAERSGNAWIVLAVPLVLPAAAEAQAVSHRVLELVNEARARPRRCGRKRFDAAAPLVLSDTLQRAALAHARDMAGRNGLSHAGSDGSTAGDRATRAGYRWRVVGENIAAGQPTAAQVVAGWLESPRHCANLMDADYVDMGVAYAVESQSAAGVYWAQVFAAPASRS